MKKKLGVPLRRFDRPNKNGLDYSAPIETPNASTANQKQETVLETNLFCNLRF